MMNLKEIVVAPMHCCKKGVLECRVFLSVSCCIHVSGVCLMRIGRQGFVPRPDGGRVLYLTNIYIIDIDTRDL